MAPVRSSVRRNQHDQNAVPARTAIPETTMAPDMPINNVLFLEPMMGTPLQIYIEKDVEDRDILVELISKHGGAVSPGYSGVPYILVDPYKESGQNLYRQYAGKKGKIVLSARWVHECISAGTLQTFHTNWANCKVTGAEKVIPVPSIPGPTPTVPSQDERSQAAQPQPQPMQPQPLPPNMPPMPSPSIDPLVHTQHAFGYQVYAHHLNAAPRALHPPTAGPPQSWQAPNGIAPQQTHMAPPPPPPSMMARPPYRDEAWESFNQPNIVGGPGAPGFDYRYRDDQTGWVGDANDYAYDPASYEQAYEQAPPYMPDPGPSTASPSTVPVDATDKPRGRKRTRNQTSPAAAPSTLVLNRRNPPARSPTPPTRVIKSTYGGNLFTSDDVLYLKKYIDYCQEQGLVLSLREICERIAVKVCFQLSPLIWAQIIMSIAYRLLITHFTHGVATVTNIKSA
ncbi:hypothetical protein SERLADRAFT_466451 [Serpula lacrymans var. lacrymans S7.9]|uniref:BRCT domain-containing protein n=1 Tax=Serpula lacrymans var. lacrymans (strain S7.9) TaxID=578457 RepID=F8NU36_SERL9|nr:uncharacterized protein SERLADRAFT_466451 [Serpula lacrymans var. lacrymans S7.9]EGO25802.1 hypothetical protein SERLADRAFT_466451 [Serpula lacrymans var. lacrymans S7.9]